MEMNNKMVFATTVLAGSLFLVACHDTSLPVEPDPVTPPPAEGNALTIINDGVPAEGFSLIVGSNTEGYAHTDLAKDATYEKANSIKVTPSTHDGDYAWKVETFNSGTGGAAEVNFIIGNDASPLDLTDYQAGTMLIDLSVVVAAASETGDHQIQLQTNTGTDDYKNRKAFYFSQNQLADLEADGWQTVAVPMSCFSVQDETGAFDITKVHQPLRFVIKQDEQVTYEIGKVVISDSAVAPEGAVAWTCE
ncbi:putative glycoside hydrolase [Agarivorans sp.]|uniref:putative glycoside hydrolase n=1 Tax=Agarivorans sp. TaxID=1872412 RepID=UPI003D02EC82